MSRSRKKWLLPLAILGGSAAIAMFVVALRPAPQTQERPKVLPIVETIAVQPQTITVTVESQGTVEATTETTLVAQVPGTIESVGSGLADGALVRAGEVLAIIDRRDYQLAVTGAEAALAQTKLGLELEQARSAAAQEEWRELGKGEAPPLAAREPQVAEAQAAVAAAEANLEQARLALNRTHIRAPFNGRVRAKLADRGQYVAPGTPVAQVISTDRAEIPLTVAQSDLRFLKAGLTTAKNPRIPVDVTSDGQGRWPATIVRSSGEIDPRSRMMTVTAAIDDPLALERDGAALPFGSFVTAAIQGIEVDGIYVLPRSALRGEDRVLVLSGDTLSFRQVEVLRIEADRVLVRSGLDSGEEVCVSALEAPVDGMRVALRSIEVEEQDEVRP